MAFNWQTFRTRTLSAVVFVAVMAVGLLWNELSFVLLFSVVHFGCWIEYYRLVKTIRPVEKELGKILLWLFMLAGCGILLYFVQALPGMRTAPLKTISWIIIRTSFLLILFNCIFYRHFITRQLLISFTAGLLYISLSLGLLIGLRTKETYLNADYALTIPLLIIFNNWINDTMAYIVGSLIGKTPLSPISPKKTWEGTIGGAVLAVATISLIAYFTGLLPVHHAAALSAIGAITGTYGDLFESKLKRMAGVKDSGTMMPGHGGFLDRFDSLLFSATACAIYVALVIKP